MNLNGTPPEMRLLKHTYTKKKRARKHTELLKTQLRGEKIIRNCKQKFQSAVYRRFKNDVFVKCKT